MLDVNKQILFAGCIHYISHARW